MSITGDDNDPKTATLQLVKQRLRVIAKHTDNYNNGELSVPTLEGRQRIADLLIDVVHSEAEAALADIERVGV